MPVIVPAMTVTVPPLVILIAPELDKVPSVKFRLVTVMLGDMATVGVVLIIVSVFNAEPLNDMLAGSVPLPSMINVAAASPVMVPPVWVKSPEMVSVFPFKIKLPACCVNVPKFLMVRALPSVTEPPEVLFSTKLLIVVLPERDKVPNAPVPPIEIFESVVVTRKFELGVKVPFIVNVLEPTERLPLSKIIVPTITKLADKETPLALLILVVIPAPVGCPSPMV